MMSCSFVAFLFVSFVSSGARFVSCVSSVAQFVSCGSAVADFVSCVSSVAHLFWFMFRAYCAV